ncbi:MAG: hypothetical protein ACC662_11650, partial [Planctomycetota bacterium]
MTRRARLLRLLAGGALAALAALVAANAPAPVGADEAAGDEPSGPPQVTLEGPSQVQGLLRADVDGDGITDLLLLQGRTVWIHPGRRGALPLPRARWQRSLPDDTDYVDGAPDAKRRGPALLVLGALGLRRVDLSTGETSPVLPDVETALDWTDSRKAAFVDFAAASGTLLLPRHDGWLLWHPPPV